MLVFQTKVIAAFHRHELFIVLCQCFVASFSSSFVISRGDAIQFAFQCKAIGQLESVQRLVVVAAIVATGVALTLSTLLTSRSAREVITNNV